jgi:hypothetical protein
VTDSERFYNSILDLLEDQDEVKEVDDLLIWWNRLVYSYTFIQYFIPHLFSQVFPSHSQPSRPISEHSALAKLKAKRMEIKERAALTNNNSTNGSRA